MARELGVTQNTARFLGQCILGIWFKIAEDVLGLDVQVEETFVGGKGQNQHLSKRIKGASGVMGKSIGVGILQNDDNVRAEPISDRSEHTLQNSVRSQVRRGATIVTNARPSYFGLKEAHRTWLQEEYNESEELKN
ncbi:hypothetical protein A8B75_18710 [Sphingomonadales bacterium EhC05]|nr:hypothetical protein A8B75_18710 [Sphingomonadales bacterium EhC05]